MTLNCVLISSPLFEGFASYSGPLFFVDSPVIIFTIKSTSDTLIESSPFTSSEMVGLLKPVSPGSTILLWFCLSEHLLCHSNLNQNY